MYSNNGNALWHTVWMPGRTNGLAAFCAFAFTYARCRMWRQIPCQTQSTRKAKKSNKYFKKKKKEERNGGGEMMGQRRKKKSHEMFVDWTRPDRIKDEPIKRGYHKIVIPFGVVHRQSAYRYIYGTCVQNTMGRYMPPNKRNDNNAHWVCCSFALSSCSCQMCGWNACVSVCDCACACACACMISFERKPSRAAELLSDSMLFIKLPFRVGYQEHTNSIRRMLHS